jgi:hypothetical protein
MADWLTYRSWRRSVARTASSKSCPTGARIQQPLIVRIVSVNITIMNRTALIDQIQAFAVDLTAERNYFRSFSRPTQVPFQFVAI